MYLDPGHCYRALKAHDARFDGRFFVGVTSTGIYCRTVCTAKTPRAGLTAGLCRKPRDFDEHLVLHRCCTQTRPRRRARGVSIEAARRS